MHITTKDRVWSYKQISWYKHKLVLDVWLFGNKVIKVYKIFKYALNTITANNIYHLDFNFIYRYQCPFSIIHVIWARASIVHATS